MTADQPGTEDKPYDVEADRTRILNVAARLMAAHIQTQAQTCGLAAYIESARYPEDLTCAVSIALDLTEEVEARVEPEP